MKALQDQPMANTSTAMGEGFQVVYHVCFSSNMSCCHGVVHSASNVDVQYNVLVIGVSGRSDASHVDRCFRLPYLTSWDLFVEEPPVNERHRTA